MQLELHRTLSGKLLSDLGPARRIARANLDRMRSSVRGAQAQAWLDEWSELIDDPGLIGSQSILGSFGEDEPSARIDGAIGEWSLFHETHGFYVQGVGRETAVLPSGWEDRLVAVQGSNTNGRTGLCLDPHDLCGRSRA